MAGREKDFEFLRVLLERGLVDFPTLLQRLQLFRPTVFANALPDRLAKLAHHLRDWQRDDLARIVETQLHGRHDPSTLNQFPIPHSALEDSAFPQRPPTSAELTLNHN